MLVAVIGGLVVLVLLMQNTLSKIKFLMNAAITGFTKVLYDKYYVDEIYDFYS
jgi:NADH-quinone oxidoreductase subunit L